MCKYCSMKPKFYDEDKNCFFYFESGVHIAEGGWTAISIGADPNGEVAMWGSGDGYTDFYYPNFCPHCGRQLRSDKEIEESNMLMEGF